MKGKQNREILAALVKGDRLTPADALRRFGCFRLGARIYDLRLAGVKIDSRRVSVDGKSFSEYRICVDM